MVRTFRLRFQDPQQGEAFSFRAGQFGEYSVFGEGESTFCIASSPTRKGYIECTFRQAGRVTTALAKKEQGDTSVFADLSAIPSRWSSGRGKSLLFIAGGISAPDALRDLELPWIGAGGNTAM